MFEHNRERMGRELLLPVITSAVFLLVTSFFVLRIDNGSLFPLLVVPTILWAVRFGAKLGTLAGLGFSIYAAAFVYFALGHTGSLPYMAIAATVLVGVGFIVGKLSFLNKKLAAQEKVVTESQRAVQKQLDEKRMLLTEVHHRIKNNLNMVTGLLTLQAASMEDAAAQEALNDAVRRMQSMSVLYDKLYRSETLEAMSVRDYLESLVESARGAFPSAPAVRLETDMEDFSLETSTLSNVGMAVNELVTNALKHAFPGRDEGTVRVTARLQDGTAVITVEDDGIGLPDDALAGESSGVGLTLVRAVVDQLEGSLTMDGHAGARFVIEFAVNKT